MFVLMWKSVSLLFQSIVKNFQSFSSKCCNPVRISIFAIFIVLISELTARLDLSVIHPDTKELIKPVSLMTIEGLHRILSQMVKNFTNFAPLGTFLVAMLGIGLAESTGLIGAALKKLVLSAPPRFLTMVIVFAGVMSNIASGVGYVLLVPLAAIIFRSVGRNPLAGNQGAPNPLKVNVSARHEHACHPGIVQP